MTEPPKMTKHQLNVLYTFLTRLASHPHEFQHASTELIAFFKGIDLHQLTPDLVLRRPDILLAISFQNFFTAFFKGMQTLAEQREKTLAFITKDTQEKAHASVVELLKQIQTETIRNQGTDPDKTVP